jgi:hypothetical protein
MRAAVIVSGVLIVSAAAAVARWAYTDIAGQGVLILPGQQGSECKDGGGCAAYSQRELQQIVNHAATVGAQYGAQSCGKSI